MSAGGWVRLYRAAWTHDLWERDAFSPREAFLWLVSKAAHKPTRSRTARGYVELGRGQLTASIRFMAAAWNWSKGRVERYLVTLENEDMIGTATGTGQLVISICNYGYYQGDESDSGTAAIQNRDRSGTGAGQTTRNQESKKEEHTPLTPQGGREADEGPSPSKRRRRRKSEGFVDPKLSTSPAFDAFWQVYPRKIGKGRAEALFERYRPDHQQVLTEAAKQYAADMKAEGRDPKHILYPATWLNPEQGEWKTYVEADDEAEDHGERHHPNGQPSQDRTSDEGNLCGGSDSLRTGQGVMPGPRRDEPGGSRADGGVARVLHEPRPDLAGEAGRQLLATGGRGNPMDVPGALAERPDGRDERRFPGQRLH